jgi:magnesium transporter
VDGYLVSTDGSAVRADRAAVVRALHAGSLLWLDLRGAGDDALEMLREDFGFHPLALKNLAEFGQRPKAENFGDMAYVVGYAATKFLGKLVEVHLCYSGQYLITVSRKGCDALDGIRAGLAADGGPAATHGGPAQLVLLHRIADSMTDSFFGPLSDLDDRIDAVLEQIFARPRQDELESLLKMQRWLVGVRKVVTPQRDVAAALMSGVTVLPGKTEAADPYLRDLYDHVIRVSDQIDSYRDLLSNGMDAYLSVVSNRQNEVMKQLTVIATVFLPLSFLTGFFGQNFGWMVRHLGGLVTFLVLGVGSELIAVAALYWLIRRRGWF